ncbi:MAG: NAD(P)/FAD-dependent oxidoreductase [Alphaproteobacteria bacterium]|nr:MAG: NAD(P)/FAD-dependent oxidoreductase [Alphaproteobacteria bacterium]
MSETIASRASQFDFDDVTIKEALSEANVPALLMAMIQINGDTSVLDGDIRPSATLFGDGEGDLTAVERDTIRDMALKALADFRDGDRAIPTAPDADLLQKMVDFMIGQKVPSKYVPLLQEELGISGSDSRDVKIASPNNGRAKEDFKALIVGAGMSGLLAAIRLKKAGIPFVVIEKNPSIGGTWYQNTYPGCRVDNPNHLYSYSFEPNHDWPLHFSTHDVLYDYFNMCADKYGVRDHIRFNTDVVQAAYDEDSAKWRVDVRGADGVEETIEVHAFISAVGQLNRPKLPDIPGIDRFKGPSFHSAEWDHSIDLTGKRVAVVGTGASAAQFVPEIAPVTSDLTVFQRTPPWISETPHYHSEVSDNIKWLLNNVPYYDKWYRFWLFWMTSEGLLPMVKVDPDWQSNDGSVSESHEMVQNMTKEYIASQLEGHPELLKMATPSYPMGGKRNLRDNGAWLGALKRDDVTLTTSPIVEITPTGVVTEDGIAHDVDVIVYGTGFTASEFLSPMTILGKDGQDLRQGWGDNPRAYLGITVPGFPNFFCLYGPNTNIVVNGSIIFFAECEVRYVLRCIKLLVEEGKASMECRQDIHDDFNVEIDAANEQMAWGLPGFNSWYKNSEGRVTQNWPHPLLDYWQVTKEPKATDFQFT